MDTILSVNSLSKYYGSLKAVNEISFQVKRGQVYGILGPNGSGKTTTLGILTGILKERNGNFEWFGKPLNGESKRKIGTILETPNFYPYLSGRKNLKITSLIKNAKKERISEVLDFVGLSHNPRQSFKKYSLGMKQRLAIASAILNDPEVLILDEPTNGLDPSGIIEIREMIMELAKQGKTILLASHLLDEVQKVCTHTLILKSGKLLYDGPIEDKNSNDLEISANNLEELELAIKDSNFAYLKDKTGDKLLVSGNELDAEKLNHTLSEKDIYLTHLVKKKVGLEKIFMEITGLQKK